MRKSLPIVLALVLAACAPSVIAAPREDPSPTPLAAPSSPPVEATPAPTAVLPVEAPPVPTEEPVLPTIAPATPYVAPAPAYVAPVYVAPKAPVGNVAILRAAAVEFGISPDWIQRISFCESGYSMAARGAAGEIGFLQFMPGTFAANVGHVGGGSIYDATAQARTGAWMLAHGQASQWSCK